MNDHDRTRTATASRGMKADLEARAAAGRPVRIGLVGSGEMGTDIVTAVAHMKGVEIAAIAEPRIDHALKAAKIAGLQAKAIEGGSVAGVERLNGTHTIAVTDDYRHVVGAEGIDVVIDATGNPNVGANVALSAMEAGKHVVMMNVESDVCIGPYLRAAAEKAGVVYSLGAGDEPTAAMELINFVGAMGYPIVAAGKGKNNPFKIDATPDAYLEEATRRNMNPRMLVEFVDGSKTMIEMAAIANATGLTVDVPGMHGPAAPKDELQKYFSPKEEGGLLSTKGVVDFSVAKGVAPGVFVVAEMSHPRVRERMSDLHLGPGPYYTFFRPYHLTSLEVPLTAVAAVLYGQSHMQPLPVPTVEVTALAKKDLPAGTKLDKIGEYCYRAFAITVADAKAKRALPCGLAEGAVTTKAIKAGDYLTYDNCAPDENFTIVRLRKEQDASLAARA